MSLEPTGDGAGAGGSRQVKQEESEFQHQMGRDWKSISAVTRTQAVVFLRSWCTRDTKVTVMNTLSASTIPSVLEFLNTDHSF